jgi:ATP-dependent HslUV protease subunit HslV
MLATLGFEMTSDQNRFRATTILTVRHKGRVAIGGDGQVSLGQTVMKSDAVKIRDRALRRLEAMIAVVDAQHTLLVSGTGDVIQPTDGILGIGSGGNFALAAARALVEYSDLSATEIVRKSLEIAADICVYSNRNIIVEELPDT